MQALIKTGIAPLYTEPTRDCELADEALYGMEVEVLERSAPGWYRVRTHYRYQGHVPAECLETDPTLAEQWRACLKMAVRRAYIDVQKEPNVESVRLLSLPRAGLLVVAGEPDEKGWVRVLLADGGEGYTKRGHLGEHIIDWSPEEEARLRRAVTDTARTYLGVQYRWGGKTPLGIDCSGLCSIAYLLNGVLIYRDASIQPGYPVREIPWDRMKEGDLLFFKGHVAMYLGQDRYIHSTARMGDEGVVINSLNLAHPDYREDLAKGILAIGSIFA